jgi:hypothetical protein
VKGDRERAVDVLGEWWADGTELAARMQALADRYRAGPPHADPAPLSAIAGDIESVLRREWDPRDSRVGG